MCEVPDYPKPRDLLAPVEGRITLTQEQVQRSEGVRAKLAELDITECDIADAIDWARGVE